MLTISAFLVLLGALLGAVWFAVANEAVTAQTKKPRRLGALSRALRRVRQGRTSPAETTKK